MRVPRGADDKHKLAKILLVINGNIDLLDNCVASVITVASTGAANTPFTVMHNLADRTPTFYIANINQNGVVYDSNRAGWNTTEMFLACSVPNASLTLLIF